MFPTVAQLGDLLDQCQVFVQLPPGFVQTRIQIIIISFFDRLERAITEVLLNNDPIGIGFFHQPKQHLVFLGSPDIAFLENGWHQLPHPANDLILGSHLVAELLVHQVLDFVDLLVVDFA